MYSVDVSEKTGVHQLMIWVTIVTTLDVDSNPDLRHLNFRCNCGDAETC